MKTVLLRAAGIACLFIVLVGMALVMAPMPYITDRWGGWAAIGALFGNAAAFGLTTSLLVHWFGD